MTKFDFIQNALNSAVEIRSKLDWEFTHKQEALVEAQENAKNDPDFWASIVEGYKTDIQAYECVFNALEQFVKKAAN